MVAISALPMEGQQIYSCTSVETSIITPIKALPILPRCSNSRQLQPADYSVIRAKTLMTNFSIEHNIALSAVDHLTDLLKVIFHDSVIASKKMVFRGTK